MSGQLVASLPEPARFGGWNVYVLDENNSVVETHYFDLHIDAKEFVRNFNVVEVS